MADLSNKIFIFLAIFYISLIVLIGLVPQDDISSELDDSLSNPTDIAVIDDFLEFFNSVFYTFTGFPIIIQTLIFGPIAGITLYWIVRFIGWAIPFVG